MQFTRCSPFQEDVVLFARKKRDPPTQKGIWPPYVTSTYTITHYYSAAQIHFLTIYRATREIIP